VSFKDMVAADNVNVFLDTQHFADEYTIKYDGITYHGVKCVVSKLKEKDRTTTMRDHAQGLYMVSGTIHFNVDDLNGIEPEKGGKILIGDGSFMERYYVAQSSCTMKMVRLELEALDE